MIKFLLDPPSGYAESCLDIAFTVETDPAEIIEIDIFNSTTDEHLDIVSVSQGFIRNEKTAVVRNSNRIEGHINLFNKDKMNDRLKDYVKVDIECVMTAVRHGQETKEASSVCFYNESQSLDASVVPFDVSIDNPHIDIMNNLPLSLHIICNESKKYELAVRSTDGRSTCTFEVQTRKGRTDFVLPSEFISHELQLAKNFNRKFQLYWVKFEGITQMKFLGRKYIPIDNSFITFNDRLSRPKSQSRLGPDGRDLSSDFMLSHRYFVHTHKEYSAFSEKIAPDIISDRGRSMYMFELMDISSKKRKPKKNNDQEVRTMIHKSFDHSPVGSKQKLLLGAYMNAYNRKTPSNKTNKSYAKTTFKSPALRQKISQMNAAPKKSGGCGCSRGKND